VKFPFLAQVDVAARMNSANHHSATHLLHQALREVLGTHVEQKGSLVAPNHLRFDFSHFQKVSEQELETIETLVNSRIRQNFSLEEFRNIPIGKAQEMGAMALFGEKYGDTVRAIKFGESIELCGGTHVPATGNIGQFKITHESAVAAGIRRLEAITGEVAENYLRQESKLLNEVKQLVKNVQDPVAGIVSLREENSRLQQELEILRAEKASGVKQEVLKKISASNSKTLLIEKVDLDNASIKNLAFELRNKHSNLFFVLANQEGDKTTLSVALGDDLVNNNKMHAGQIVKELAALVKGGGGGQAFFATAGGKDVSGIAAALNRATELANQ
jgi:alanyl-tRNA synthetase